ncbi:uncharacterized protein LOC126895968 [Daktulosphaira vitifoliae]|uniref:uncharacterized protein LOC126895968 n=1 Tax=Daktulosphaira vitifoliae TaxID=58002 RepID=UPI0021A9DAE9|nr:uncharacterized protein LOC126895968 [Daktulosphaira vitifoliae]
MNPPEILQILNINQKYLFYFASKKRFNHLPPDADTYNTYFPIFHLIEFLYAFIYWLFAVTADIILITVCLSILGQLEVINECFENIGVLYKENIIQQSINVKVYQKKIKFDLKNIIYNSQNVIRKMKQFYDTFRQIILIQIVVTFINLVLFSYTGMLNYINGGMVNLIQTVKLISALLFFVFHLFILCFVFGIINDKKESMLFGIYNSYWTEINIENKRLVLLTMKMISAHQSKMNITRNKTVDLIMFVGKWGLIDPHAAMDVKNRHAPAKGLIDHTLRHEGLLLLILG